jgi:hypothetical protein
VEVGLCRCPTPCQADNGRADVTDCSRRCLERPGNMEGQETAGPARGALSSAEPAPREQGDGGFSAAGPDGGAAPLPAGL